MATSRCSTETMAARRGDDSASERSRPEAALPELQAPAPATERELVITRTFDAPRELVFEAFTDPRHVSSWWGPIGFTMETEHMDVRPGGTWKHVMRGPDGTDYPNFIRYEEVRRPER